MPAFRHHRALPGVLSGANLSFRVRPTVGTAGCATGAQKLQKLRVPGAGLTRMKSVPCTCDRLATSPRVSGPRAERRRANEQGHTTVRPECQPAAASSQKARRTPAPSLAAHDHYPMRRCTPAARTERNGLARPHALDLYGLCACAWHCYAYLAFGPARLQRCGGTAVANVARPGAFRNHGRCTELVVQNAACCTKFPTMSRGGFATSASHVFPVA